MANSPVYGDWHLTEADIEAGKVAEELDLGDRPVPTPGTSDLGDWHLTKEDRKLNRKVEKEAEKSATPLAAQYSKPDLEAMAKDAQLDATGTKEEIAARLVKAGKLNPPA